MLDTSRDFGFYQLWRVSNNPTLLEVFFLVKAVSRHRLKYTGSFSDFFQIFDTFGSKVFDLTLSVPASDRTCICLLTEVPAEDHASHSCDGERHTDVHLGKRKAPAFLQALNGNFFKCLVSRL